MALLLEWGCKDVNSRAGTYDLPLTGVNKKEINLPHKVSQKETPMKTFMLI